MAFFSLRISHYQVPPVLKNQYWNGWRLSAKVKCCAFFGFSIGAHIPRLLCHGSTFSIRSLSFFYETNRIICKITKMAKIHACIISEVTRKRVNSPTPTLTKTYQVRFITFLRSMKTEFVTQDVSAICSRSFWQSKLKMLCFCSLARIVSWSPTFCEQSFRSPTFCEQSFQVHYATFLWSIGTSGAALTVHVNPGNSYFCLIFMRPSPEGVLQERASFIDEI